LASLVRRERKGKRRGAAGSAAAAAGRRGRGGEERKGERERLTSGAQASARARKKKKRERTRAGAGRRMAGCWAVWAQRREGKVFPFFLFFFKLLFKTTFLFKFKSNSFKLFFLKIYKLFRNHTSNQKPCKPTDDDAQSLVVSMFIKLCLIF
jgi:hypothetical protein